MEPSRVLSSHGDPTLFSLIQFERSTDYHLPSHTRATHLDFGNHVIRWTKGSNKLRLTYNSEW